MELYEYLSSVFKGDMLGYLRFEIRTIHLFLQKKYVNAEAATLFIIIFAFGLDYFASAFTYFCAERSASYVSRSVDIRTYLL